ncbi:MAG: alkaline phosphatase family protein [Planctomycetes bacterium]|nr:alkaline phosphatase family protein [Planctomycetota bacterium]
MIRVCMAWLVLSFVALAQQSEGRLIVLGFDGLDHGRVQEMMASGQLPALSRLAESGSFRRLESTNPAISPVSWAALTTGLHPGRTGIDGFLRRDFSDGEVKVRLSLGERQTSRKGLESRATRRWVILVPLLLCMAASIFWQVRGRRGRGWLLAFLTGLFALALWVSEFSLPDGRPIAVNLRHGKAFWERLDEAGIETTTTFAPCAFPAPDLDHGHLLCGLGVPDIAGGMGYWTLFRDDIAKESFTETGGRLTPLRWEDPEKGDGLLEPVRVYGPPNFVAGTDEQISKPLQFLVDRKVGTLTITDGLEHRQFVKGTRSEPFDFLFRLSSWARVRGQSRFHVTDLDDAVKVYLDPIGFHPGELPPGVKISHPKGHAWQLWEEVGAFETVGWACATNALKDNMIDEKTFLDDAERVWSEQEAIARHELARKGPKVVTAIFTVPDRIQHMFTRFDWTDVDARGQEADPRFKNQINQVYERVDRFVAEVMDDLRGPNDRIVVVSDHGFAPWRRAVNLNAWLVQEGLLVLHGKTGKRTLHGDLASGQAFGQVDWSRTKAYSCGLGRIYLNRKGREPHGIVGDAEADALIARLMVGLDDLRDRENPVVSRAVRGAELHADEAIPNGPADIYVGFHRGYRVSWQSCLGGCDEPVIFENRSAWSGDHCSVDPSLVPGVLVTDLALRDGEARVVDIGATVMAWAGLVPGFTDARDGRSLLP